MLIALYENATPFEYRNLEEPAANAELAALPGPLKRFPVLLDDGRCILEQHHRRHLQAHHPGPVSLIPPGDAGLESYAGSRLRQLCDDADAKVVLDALRPVADRDRYGVTEAREMLNQIYPWPDQRLEGRHWIASADFTLADCAAAPQLFYADWAPDPGWLWPSACLSRPSAQSSLHRAGGGGEAIRHYFPLGIARRD